MVFGTPEVGQRLIPPYRRSPGKPGRPQGKEAREEVEGGDEGSWGGSAGLGWGWVGGSFSGALSALS